MSLQENNQQILKYIIQSRNSNYKISFPIGNNKEVEIPIGKVSHIQADGVLSKCFLYDSDKEYINIATPFRDLEKELQKYAFIRPHRSFMINCSFIKNWECEGNGKIELFCGTEIPIARRKKVEIMTFLKKMGLE